MNRVMRRNDFGSGREASRSEYPVSRSVVQDGARGGAFGQWWNGNGLSGDRYDHDAQ